MKSKICEILNIEFPLLAFSHCKDVVAQVSKAGGMGVVHRNLSIHKQSIEVLKVKKKNIW